MPLKNRLKNIRYQSFKFRIFFNFLLITVVTVIIMNIITFQYFDSYMKHEINNISRTKLDNISTVYNNQLEQYHHIVQTIYRTPSVASYIYSSGETSLLEAIDVSNYLKPTLSTNEAIDSIFLFNNGQIIHEIDSRTTAMELKQQILDKIWETKSDQLPVLIQAPGGDQKIVLFHTNRDTLYGQSTNGVVMILNTEALRKTMLSDYASQPDQILLADGQNHVFISQNGSEPVDFALLKKINDSPEEFGSFTENLSNSPYIISFVKNTRQSYSVISLIDYQSSMEKLLQLRNLMIFFTIGVIAAAFFVSYLLTNHLYKPIHNMLYHIQDTFKRSDGDEPRYDEMKSAALAITHAATKMEQLESQQYSAEILQYLKHGGMLPGQLADTAEEWGKGYQYRIALLESDEGSSHKQPGNGEQLSQSVSAACAVAFGGGSCQQYRLYQLEYDQIMIVLNESKESGLLAADDTLYRDFSVLLSRLASESGIYLSAGISGISDDINRITACYSKACKLVRCRLLCGKNQIYLADNFVFTPLDEEKSKACSELILDHVKNDNLQQLSECTRQLFSLLRHTDYEQSLKYLANLLTDAKNLSRNASTDSREYRSSYLDTYLKIQSCGNQEELLILLQQILNDACLELRVAKSKTVQLSMLDSIQYIEEHYGDDDLSVDVLADQCHISASYFSKLFNSYTQKSFPDYINHLRLQKAADLLLSDQTLSINEIARQVGFKSNSYFAASFKKRYGTSPSKFRISYKG